MSPVPRTLLVSSLVVCVLAVSLWLPLAGVGHASHHSHHSSATHADPFCTLLCSAGKAVHASGLILPSTFAPLSAVTLAPVEGEPSVVTVVSLSRGPPRTSPS